MDMPRANDPNPRHPPARHDRAAARAAGATSRRLATFALVLALPVTIAVLLSPDALAAQSPASAEVAALGEALERAKRDHLWRVAIWGGANVALGVGLLASGSRDVTPRRFGFGVQSAAWGAINLGIVGFALLSGDPEPPTTLSAALAAENGWSDVLLVNLGLNVGYMGVGTALAIAAGRGLSRPDEVRGHAYGVIVQGAGLFLLDGVAWLSSRARLDTLVEMASATEIGLVPMTAVHPLSGEVMRSVGVVIGVPIG